MKKKKLVILGGTFDPVHNGHIYSAQAVYEQLQPEKILFIPAFIAPHKVGQECAPAADRYAMTVLATEAYPYFEVSDMELRRSGISYTLDTVRELGRLYPEHELYFLIGADTIPQLQTWHKIDELLQLVILWRPNVPVTSRYWTGPALIWAILPGKRFCWWIRRNTRYPQRKSDRK